MGSRHCFPLAAALAPVGVVDDASLPHMRLTLLYVIRGDYVFQDPTMPVLLLVVLDNPSRTATAAVTAAVAVRNQGLKEQKRLQYTNVSERKSLRYIT